MEIMTFLSCSDPQLVDIVQQISHAVVAPLTTVRKVANKQGNERYDQKGKNVSEAVKRGRMKENI